jgi:aarF domain-containing kinase
VAVKFQNPGIEKKFRADIKTLKSFAELAMPQHVSAFKEIEKQFTTEFDYVREAQSLKLAHDLTMPKWNKHFVIPEPYINLCSKNILVMEYLDGVKMVDGIRAQYQQLAKLAGFNYINIS